MNLSGHQAVYAYDETYDGGHDFMIYWPARNGSPMRHDDEIFVAGVNSPILHIIHIHHLLTFTGGELPSRALALYLLLLG